MQHNGVPRDTSTVVIYSFISESLIIAFYIMIQQVEVEVIWANFLTTSSYFYLNVKLILTRSFEFAPTYRYTYYPLLPYLKLGLIKILYRFITVFFWNPIFFAFKGIKTGCYVSCIINFIFNVFFECQFIVKYGS